MPKLDPELLPEPRPRCPNCRMRMVTTGVATRPVGAETLSFECLRCGHRESMKSDPMKSKSAAWLSGELGHSAVEHVILNGRMVPKKH